jgi:hypothetical protein
MSKREKRLSVDQLGQLIYEIRGQRVMLDAALAAIYRVETKALNRAVKRNRSRFPKDFAFQISPTEWKNLRYQIGTSSSREHQRSRSQFVTSRSHGGRRYLPHVFTAHGAIMAANVLNSRRADECFCGARVPEDAGVTRRQTRPGSKLASVEKELKKRLDVHEAVIVTILQRVMDIIDPPALPGTPKPRIGFQP